MNMNAVPNLGKGEVRTEEEIQQMIKAKHANLSCQFMGAMLANVPTVTVFDPTKYGSVEEAGSDVGFRLMTAKEMFAYTMELVENVENYLNAEKQTDLKQ